MLADIGGAYKSNGFYIGVGQKNFGLMPGTGDNVDDAVRKAGLFVQFRKPEGGLRGKRRRF